MDNKVSSLSLIPLGGVGDVTKNMYVYEFNNEMLVIDCGLGFPDQTMLGVDLLIPDTSHLLKNIHKIKGMLLTHGHEDHIGALPYVLGNLSTKKGPPDFPIFGTKLTAALANSKLVEFGFSPLVKTMDFNEQIKVGNFQISLIRVTHSILDSAHYVITTPVGTFYHGSDFKLDKTPVDGKPTETQKIIEASKKGITLASLDCLRSEKEGRTPSEIVIEENFEKELKNCSGQFIVTTYSSNISRLNQAIRIAQKYNRKVCFVGRSLQKARDVALKLGYLELKRESEVDMESVKNYPRNRMMLLIAGSQGQENSALTRIADDGDKFIRIFEDDMVIFSADPIPGNEIAVHSLIDTLAKRGAKVFYSEITDDLHVSGHAAADDLKDMIQMIKARYLLPIGGTYRQMVRFRELGEKMGYQRKDIFLIENGQEILFGKNFARIGRKIPLRNIYVDEITGEEIHQYVLRDRQKLSEHGIIVLLIEIDTSTGQVVGEPDIISRGFIMEDEKWLTNSLRKKIRQTLARHRHQVTNWTFIRKTLEEKIETFIFQRTHRHPLILPIVIEV